MRHHAFAAAMGLLTAAVFAPCSPSQAASSDPTGYWYKPDAERESKIQVFKCGKAKSQLCAKIAWLKDPKDSKGRPLHDIRNEVPSMRDRPIVGLMIFTGLTPSAPATWTGKIYNPEDGHTYTATLTVLSRKEIKLRGCKAWLLCGEKQWLRTSAPEEIAPAAPAEGTQQIEASVTPQTQPDAAPKVEAVAAANTSATPSAEATASAAPSDAAPLPQDNMQAMAAPEAPAEQQSTEALRKTVAMPVEEVAVPAATPAEYNGRSGYGFLNVSAGAGDKALLSGENVSSMIVMTKPLPAGAVAPAAATPAQPAIRSGTAPHPVAVPDEKPKSKPIATAAVKPAPKPVPQAKPTEQAMPEEATAEQIDPDAQDAAMAQSAQAEAAIVEEPPMTRRQKRLLRKQQQEETFLPWMR